jgi:hypothetical protein
MNIRATRMPQPPASTGRAPIPQGSSALAHNRADDGKEMDSKSLPPRSLCQSDAICAEDTSFELWQSFTVQP